MEHYPKIANTAFEELSYGFHPKSFDLYALDLARLETSTRAWERIAAVLLGCSRGNFSRLPELGPLMRDNPLYLLWHAIANISGYAGTLQSVRQTFDYIEDKSGDNFLFFLAIALGATSNLAAVDYLMEAHKRAGDIDPLRQIEQEISFLLEAEDGPLMAGSMEEVLTDEGWVERANRERYFDQVKQAQDAVLERVGSKDIPIYGGEAIDIAKIAKRMYDNLDQDDEREQRLAREATLFEAATGINCSKMFDRSGNLKSLHAAGILEAFFDGDQIESFRPGQRYFFGHPIAT
ncbi:hypothetical protein [Mesorhizobium sp. WSM4884]|uniref:hypothetical protein n=1 Tax=Mesorhizobium sp. WSM4884 TaxID=3038542 RepID=UPI0024166079|nr:hypothetical protein [Mesorhizobium sp. WSM4884]MDG4880745.1 hypothetical protein [Mesorhizobium sp. WSM4884]